jgi:ubiquitin carboxyl-terminal hydrolase 7
MIFIKHFDASKQSLLGIGKVHVPSASKLRDLTPIINMRMGWAGGTTLMLYKVVKGTFSPRHADRSNLPQEGNSTALV